MIKMLPRVRTTELGKTDGRDTIEVVVRAASKPGAILTARADAVTSIPVREQSVDRVESLDNDRFLNKWKVEISDTESMKSLGR